MIEQQFSEWLKHPITKLVFFTLESELKEATNLLLNINRRHDIKDIKLTIGELIGAMNVARDLMALNIESIRELALDYVHTYPEQENVYGAIDPEDAKGE